MRKFFALSLLIMAALSAIYFTACNNNKTESQAANEEDSLKQVIERGKYLATYVVPCLDCHSKRDWTKFSGPVLSGTEGMGGEVFDHTLFDAMPGTVFAKNITSDSATGIGAWTDDELLRAMTQGINKNGDTLFPIMPYANLNHMVKKDLLSIIAYIRTLKPIKNTISERQLMIPISMAYPAPALQPSVDANAAPPESDRVKFGEYLVTMADCGTCHTPFVQGQPDFSRSLSGGNTFTLETFKVTSANITPDSATGIGTWTEDAFIAKFENNSSDANVNRDPGKMNSIMPWSLYGKMGEANLRAIYAYLRTIPPISNKVEKYPQ
jgi:mono/diheme cytochrome c family protein